MDWMDANEVIHVSIYSIIISIITGISAGIISHLLFKIKRERSCNENTNIEIVSNVLQIVAYDYHVRAIKCGYGEIMDHVAHKYMRFDDTIQWKCIELGSSPKNMRYTVNFYKEKTLDSLVYIVNYRLFGNYYIAYGKNPLIAWSIVIRNARAENRKIFSRYPDRQKIK